MSSHEKYRVIRKLDSGGMAEIFLGEAESIEGFKKRVAIKRVLPHLVENRKFLAMFLDEARLSLRFNNANVVQTFDIGRSGNTYFVVMEYVDGTNLKRVVEHLRNSGQRLPVELAVFIAIEVCRGLSYAHNFKDQAGNPLGIVHRDVSPPNVLLSKQGEVKIVDFGLAKATSQLEETDPGVVKGKFAYLAPEAARGEVVDHRADIFACGIILYEMLSGKRLFLGKSDVQTIELVRNAKVPSITSINPEVPAQLEQIVRKALALNPKDRYQGCHELAEILAGFLFEYGRRVTSFDLQRFVQTISSQDMQDEIATPSIIDQLIQEEMVRFSSLDSDSVDATGFGGDDAGSGSDPLDPTGFEDPRTWAGELNPIGHDTPLPDENESGVWRESALRESSPEPIPLQQPRDPIPGIGDISSAPSLAQMLEGEGRLTSNPPADETNTRRVVIAIAVGGGLALIGGITAFALGWIP
ncbi:MAG: serine/threonine-protein kinase [Myxococcota bacterium]|nr:serine/threonine-protein kinase [Myxococcota bacterium]